MNLSLCWKKEASDSLSRDAANVLTKHSKNERQTSQRRQKLHRAANPVAPFTIFFLPDVTIHFSFLLRKRAPAKTFWSKTKKINELNKTEPPFCLENTNVIINLL